MPFNHTGQWQEVQEKQHLLQHCFGFLGGDAYPGEKVRLHSCHSPMCIAQGFLSARSHLSEDLAGFAVPSHRLIKTS